MLARRRLGRILEAIAVCIFAFPSFLFLNSSSAERRALSYGAGVLLYGTGLTIGWIAARDAERKERALAKELSTTRQQKIDGEAHLLRLAQRDRRVFGAVTTTLVKLQRRQTIFLCRETKDLDEWDAYADAALEDLTKLWRDLYFKGDIGVRIRATLFEVDGDELKPLRRSNGGAQYDKAVTPWKLGEGAAGITAASSAPCLVADVRKALAAASASGFTPLFAIRPNRPDHLTIRSVFCTPLRDTDDYVRWVLSLDTKEPLPFTQGYYENASDSPARITEPLVAEFSQLLMLKPEASANASVQ